VIQAVPPGGLGRFTDPPDWLTAERHAGLGFAIKLTEREALMSFVHIANFTWKDHTTPADVEQITVALRALAPELSGVDSYRCGADVSRTPDSYDYAVVGVFADRDHFVGYRDHPEHQRILKELILPHLAARVLVQLED
jgi:hypothetical protein